MRSGGEGRPFWNSGWREDMLEEMLEVEGEQGPSWWPWSGAEQCRVQRQSQPQGASFTTVVSTFRLPKIPSTDCLPLINRMSPVLLARCRARPAAQGAVWVLCREAELGAGCWAGQAAALPPMPLHVQAWSKGGKLHPLPVLASLLPSERGERLPPPSSSTFQCKDLANFFYE